jgi:transcriptional regulator with XRE-family HTH domain
VSTIDIEQVGVELGRLRRRKEVLAADVAQSVGVDPSTLSKIENGSRRVDVKEFTLFAQALGLQAGDLLPRTSGVPLRFRPLLQMLESVSDGELQRLMNVAGAMFDLQANADTNRQEVTGDPRKKRRIPAA